MSTRPDFVDVMTGLYGIRLAAWDELAERGSATAERLAAWLHPRASVAETMAALSWLMANRLVCLDADSLRWKTVPVQSARQVYEEYGPLHDPANRPQQVIPEFSMTQLQVSEPPKVRVHAHQAQFELVA